GPPRQPRSPDSADRPRDPSPKRPSIFVQYACELTDHEHALASFADQKQDDLDRLEQDARKSLSVLRARLITIGALTLAAVLLGSVWIVHRGLAPLRRLSDAVSRVAPHHLELPFSETKLPAELSPIVQRLSQTLEQLKRAFQREKQATADI